MLQHLDLDAQLVVSVNESQLVVVAQENYVIINFKDSRAFEGLLKHLKSMRAGNASSKPSDEPVSAKAGSNNPLKKLNELNDKIRGLGIMLEVRVGNKTYVTFGGSSAKITASAIMGALGMFFRR